MVHLHAAAAAAGPNPLALRAHAEALTQALSARVGGGCHAHLLAVLPVLNPRIEARQVAEAWPVMALPPVRVCQHVLAHLGYQITGVTLQPRMPGGAAACLLVRPDDLWLIPAGAAVHKGQVPVWQARARAWVSLPLRQVVGQPASLLKPVSSATTAAMGPFHHRFRCAWAPVVAMSLAIQCLGLLVPVLTMVVYDRIIGGQTPVGYLTLAVGILLVLSGEAALRHLRGRLLVWLAIRWDAMAATLVLGQLLHLPAAMIEQAAVSNQLGRLKGFEVIRETATSPVILGILDLPFVLVLLGALAWVGGPLVVVPLVLLGTYLLLMGACLPWVKTVLSQGAAAQEQRQRLLLETCRQPQALRADGLTGVWQQRLAEAGLQAGLAGGRGNHMQHVLETFSQLSSNLAGLATMAYGIHLVLAGQLGAGALVASMMLVWRVLAPLSLLCTSLPRLVQLQQTLVQLRRLLQLVPETPPLAPPMPQVQEPATLQGRLQFHQVGLRYAREHEPVMAGLSFTVTPGQLVAVAGRNGSGKSTLLKLVLGLYQPQSGSVRLDGLDIRQWHPERLRQQVAYLPQHPELFPGTLAHNLRLADPLASETRLWTALDQAGAAEAVQRLPGGLHHQLHNAGSLPLVLQYQLSLARLFLKPAPLVLCDELPNALLNGSVGIAFRQWLAGLRGHSTVLMVSHRQDFIQMADLAIGLRIEQTPLIGAPHHVLAALQAERPDATVTPFQPQPLITAA